MTKYIGQPLPRLEDEPFIRGAAEFSADLDLAGQGHAVVLRAPHAHAEVAGVDAAAARAAPGVVAVFTAADLRAAGIGAVPSGSKTMPLPPGNSPAEVADGSQYPLAEDRVRYVGEPVALVVAETGTQALDAAELIEVDYRPLDAVVDPDAALGPNAPKLWPELADNRSFAWDAGDAAATEAALAGAARRVEVTVEYPREVVAFMEPRAALAEFDAASGRYTLHAGCQSGHRIKPVLAGVLGVDEQSIRVVVPEVGGGFGARGGLYPEMVLVAFAARALGRPVKWMAERAESFVSDTQARSQRLHGTLGFDAEGRIVALQLAARWWHGGYLATGSALVIVQWMSPMVCGPYRVPTYHFAIDGVFTNTTPIGAYRGVARAEATYVLERLMDRAAREIGIDRVALRRRNLIARAEMPWTVPTGAVYQPADFARSLEQGLDAADWAGFAARRAAAAARGRLRGIAVTTYIENAGGALSEYAELAVAGDGRITAHVGSQDFGMGHATVFAQVIGEVLGVAPDAIEVIDGDTDRIPIGFGAHGSRVMRIGGGAVHQGGHAVIEAGRPLAADLLEAAAADIEYRDGRYLIGGTDRTVGLFEVAGEAARRGTPLLVQETFQVPGPSYPNGCHLAEVEVDPETGRVTIERYVVVSDPGQVINPLLAAGQLHGGIAQGIGQALMEGAVFDPETGQPLTGSFMDYAMPRADDLPAVTTLFNPVEGDDNPLGVKGIGEGPTTASPPTVVNAVLDALAGRGVSHLDMPLTPETVWRALQEAKA